MSYNGTLNTIPLNAIPLNTTTLNDYKESVWFLYTIHSIICCIFSNKHSTV